MYKYTCGIDSIKSIENINFYLSDNNKSCLSINGNMEARKTSQGLYIDGSNVLLLNFAEILENSDKIYKLNNYSTNICSCNNSEFIEKIDLEKNEIYYKFSDEVKMKKAFLFDRKRSILQVKYELENLSQSKLEFSIAPLVTCRDFFNMKNENMLKFNQRKTEKGVILNLSITSNINLIIKSSELKYTKETLNICNVKHTYIESDSSKKEIFEDVQRPGIFKCNLKKGEVKQISIYISSKEFSLEEVENKNLFLEETKFNEKLLKNIQKEYVELRDLVLGISKCSLDSKLISSLPYVNDNSKIDIEKNEMRIDQIINSIKDVTDIVRAIEGQYLILGKVKDAKVILIKIRRYIKEIEALKLDDMYVLKEITLLKLWFVESINRLYTKDSEIGVFVPHIKEIIFDTINSKNKELILEDLECVCLIYNALKIYENMSSAGLGEEIVAYNTYKKIEKLLEEEFFIKDKNILKSNLRNYEEVANISMLYSISLSYPCIIGNMKMKILDTIFKELYTPYGLREVAKSSDRYEGNIYPKYMAHFLKANFRQNGVTRASQKLAYNLVKELLQEISKSENGGVRKIYNDKGKNIDSIGYDILTNAEMIRVYNMLV